jgi:protein-S-isoprenylcysteine O-methyltransferase Ste14
MKSESSLKVRAFRKLATTLLGLAVILFLPAGTLRFWHAWLFVALQAAFYIFFFADFLRNDPQLLERRLQIKEADPEQKWFQKLWIGMALPAFILTALDFRFGWTRNWTGPVSLAMVLAGQAVVVAGYWLVFWVMKTNSFAASTIRVESEQRVIDSGPYAIVRHPMYFGMALSLLGSPLALGSYVTLPLFVVLVALLAFRLIHEERTLRLALPGYSEYCEHTRFRLVPWVW